MTETHEHRTLFPLRLHFYLQAPKCRNNRPKEAMKAQRADTAAAQWKHIWISMRGIQREEKK